MPADVHGAVAGASDDRKKKPMRGGRGRRKVKKVMGEFKRGNLHSGSKRGPKVTDRKQAIAIAMKQSGMSRGTGGRVRSS